MINPFRNCHLLTISPHLAPLFMPRTMSSSDVEMHGSSNSDSELDTSGQVCVAPDVAAACKRGPERVGFEGKRYVWKAYEDNQRAFTKPSIIWQLGDGYEKVDSGYRRKYWRCGLCTKTKMLVMNDNSTSGLCHLKKERRIDRNGQRMGTKQSTITAFAPFRLHSV
jgi:hypothetical protein